MTLRTLWAAGAAALLIGGGAAADDHQLRTSKLLSLSDQSGRELFFTDANGHVHVTKGVTAQELAEAWSREMRRHMNDDAVTTARLDECEKWLRRTEPKLLDDDYTTVAR